MTTQDFIKLEAEALKAVSKRDPAVIWEAIECGALEHIRFFAETQDYNVSVTDLVRILWVDITYYKKLQEKHQVS
jgi:hypothetical protein